MTFEVRRATCRTCTREGLALALPNTFALADVGDVIVARTLARTIA
jgi:hypothetical protein